MTFTILFLIAITAFILIKIKTIAERHELNSKLSQRLLISGMLVILFVITNATLPYPESIYWFIVLGVISIVTILSFEVIKKEFKRFALLPTKERIINLTFYSLLVTVTSILI